MIPLPREDGDGLHAEVLWVDRFGNCQLNVGPDELDPAATPPDVWTRDDRRRAAGRPPVGAYAELGAGVVGLVLDSHGMYALALDQRSAAAELGLAAGDAVVLAAARRDAGTQPGVDDPVELHAPLTAEGRIACRPDAPGHDARDRPAPRWRRSWSRA